MRLGLNLGYWGMGNDAENLALARVADELGYSAATIKADITSLSAMLGAHGRAEILQRAKRAGL